MSDLSNLYIPIKLDKNHINRLLASKLSVIELRDNLKITNIKINGQGTLFTLDLLVAGMYNGVLQVTFKPRFDKSNHRLILDDLKIEMLEKGFLSKGLNWMMKGVMQNKIEETIQSQLDKKLQEIVKEYLNKSQKVSLPDGLMVDLKVKEFDILDMFFENSMLHISTDVKGQIVLQSDSSKMA